MGVVTRSLWLPIGPANFFSAMTDPALLLRDAGALTGGCRSGRQEGDAAYVPYLRESVFRRLVEVLPISFGYDREGTCQFSGDQNDRSRPTSVTMTLRPAAADVRLAGAVKANRGLCEAMVETVSVRIDEVGFYTFTATHGGTDDDQVADALTEHICVVFGGDFAVNRLEPMERRGGEGVAAVRRYNGLRVEPPAAGEPEVPQTPPLGALSFYQLNVMVEGLCNQSLLPAVFFEHYDEARRWLDDYRRRSSVLTNLNDFLREIMVSADAATAAGQVATLHRFLVISRGTLQWMRRAVESVRRSLLDQMMAVSHRQARLVQLDLAGVDYERTPEMTGEATESQMRGYVMLVATKLPLLFTVADGASDAMGALAKRWADAERRADTPETLLVRIDELGAVVDSWAGLLDRLRHNVRSLETAVEHDWQERLLYEQEQARSEQEAMAEIERTRRGRPESRRMGDAAYNAVMLILTAVTVFFAIQAAESSTVDSGPLWRKALNLWPVAVVAVVFFLAWPGLAGLRRLIHQRKPDSEVYSFEFAFRIDERAERHLVHAYLAKRGTQRIKSAGFKRIKLRRLGGWRVERLSTDTTLLKVHSVAVIRVAPLRYARFEIVTEIMIRRISNNSQFFVRQCRMFGDSTVPLTADQVVDLVGILLRNTCAPLAVDFDLAALTGPIDLLRPVA